MQNKNISEFFIYGPHDEERACGVADDFLGFKFRFSK